MMGILRSSQQVDRIVEATCRSPTRKGAPRVVGVKPIDSSLAIFSSSSTQRRARS